MKIGTQVVADSSGGTGGFWLWKCAVCDQRFRRRRQR